MPTPLVSVIVPNYCHAKFLSQRLDSIFSQSYKNYEVIILDDASPDNGASQEVIEQYRTNEHVSHIVYNEKNSGSTFVQWQKGINLANGDLIWIAESDDYCCSTLLEELIKAYNRQENCVLAYSSLIVVDENGKTLFRRRKFNNQYYSGEEYLKRYLSLGCFVQNASCAVFSKKAALSISQDYTTLKSAGDYMFWVLITEKGNVAIVNKNLSFFRRHTGTVTGANISNGVNFISEKLIFDYITQRINLTKFRRYFVYSYHAFKIKRTSFLSDEIKTHVYKVWSVGDYCSFLNEALCFFSGSLRRFWGYHI